MAFCEQCGSAIGENAKFCRNCGNPVEAVNIRIPVKVNRPQAEKTEKPAETVISWVGRIDWRNILQKSVSTAKKWWTSTISWTKQRISDFWQWKWGKVILPMVALILVGAFVLPLFVKSEPVGVCSNCGNVVAKKAYECAVCGVEFDGEYTILAFSMAEVKLPATEFDPPYVPEVEEFVPDYRPGHENTNGTFGSNWANGGHIAEQDGWIYYCFWGSLYKMPIDGTEQDVVKLFDKEVNSINVVGNWIYCCCYDYEGRDDCLLRIRTDGAVVEKLDTVYGVDVIVMDGYAYYIKDNQLSASKNETIMYRINIETLEKEAFLHENDVGSSFGIENYTGGAITIWLNGGSDQSNVFSTGEVVNRSGINEDEARWDQNGHRAWLEPAYTESVSKGGWYADHYLHIIKGGDYEYDDCRIGPFDNVGSLYLANFNQYLVMSSYDMFDGAYLYDANTGEIAKINGDNMANVQYAGEYIYYSTDISHPPRYRCKLDGSDWSEIDWMCP